MIQLSLDSFILGFLYWLSTLVNKDLAFFLSSIHTHTHTPTLPSLPQIFPTECYKIFQLKQHPVFLFCFVLFFNYFDCKNIQLNRVAIIMFLFWKNVFLSFKKPSFGQMACEISVPWSEVKLLSCVQLFATCGL